MKPSSERPGLVASVVAEGAETAEIAIPELGISETVKLVAGRGTITIDAAPLLWSPERPKLYDVHVTAGDDSVSDRVGFRTIERKGP